MPVSPSINSPDSGQSDVVAIWHLSFTLSEYPLHAVPLNNIYRLYLNRWIRSLKKQYFSFDWSYFPKGLIHKFIFCNITLSHKIYLKQSSIVLTSGDGPEFNSNHSNKKFIASLQTFPNSKQIHQNDNNLNKNICMNINISFNMYKHIYIHVYSYLY